MDHTLFVSLLVLNVHTLWKVENGSFEPLPNSASARKPAVFKGSGTSTDFPEQAYHILSNTATIKSFYYNGF